MEVLTEPLTVCSGCGASDLIGLFDLPDFPHIGVFLDDPAESVNFPLIDNSLNFCSTCGHIQLGATVDPSFLYTISFQHQTSQSASATQANEFLFEFVRKVYTDREFPQTVVEIGCNDTFLLKQFIDQGAVAVGVDPILEGRESEFRSAIGEEYSDRFRVIGNFVEKVDFEAELGLTPDLFISNFVFEHIRDPLTVTAALIEQMDDNSVCIIGVPGSEFMVYNSRFDQLSHQHYQQFNMTSFQRMIVRAGGEVIATTVNFSNWGQIIVAFRRATTSIDPENLSSPYSLAQVQESKELFDGHIDSLRRRLDLLNNKPTVGFGAAQNFPVFAYFCGYDLPIDEILDDHPLRQNRYFPHLPYRITAPEDSYSGFVGILTGPDYSRVLVPRMAQLGFDHILVPFSAN